MQSGECDRESGWEVTVGMLVVLRVLVEEGALVVMRVLVEEGVLVVMCVHRAGQTRSGSTFVVGWGRYWSVLVGNDSPS